MAERTPGKLRYLAALTPRQLAIAELVAMGCTNQQIAAAVGLSINTIEHHLTDIFRRTGVSNRVQLALLVNEGRSAANNGEAGIRH